MLHKLPWFLSSLFVLGNAIALPAEDWLQFRGKDASSLAPHADPPIEFSSASKKNVAWKVDLPGRSAGGAIVVGNQVIATSSQGLDQRRIYITSVDSDTGKRVWQQSFVARGRPFTHPYSSNAAPTPASDGQRIFAFYSSNDLVCLDLQGQLVWYRSLASEFPKAGNDNGMSSSPLVVDGVVVVQIECQGDSFAAGVDAVSGELLWRVDRPRKINWSSPAPITRTDGSQLVVLTSGEDVTGLVARTGEAAFKYDKGSGKIPSTLAWQGKLLIASNGLTVLDCQASDASPKKLWDNNKLEPGNCSPIVFDDAVVLIKGGVLSVGDLADGSLRYKLRLPDAGSIWSTPVVCQDRLYVFTDKGRCFVVQLGKTSAEVIATNEIDDTILGSPAVSGDALFLRGDRTLWKIAKK
ncbi:MAG: PQQ-binding-like beta-propeller repeat protein [Pirellulaceae bacterium]|nr:PQQ-binding-like beta-propeller repeat protein [Pirellulaceae bacterium]